MKISTGKVIALFFSGFFAKDLIDNIFFLVYDDCIIRLFGLKVTKSMRIANLAASAALTILLLYFGIRRGSVAKRG